MFVQHTTLNKFMFLSSQMLSNVFLLFFPPSCHYYIYVFLNITTPLPFKYQELACISAFDSVLFKETSFSLNSAGCQFGNEGAERPVGNEGAERRVGNEGAERRVGTEGAERRVGNEGAERQVGTEGAERRVGNEGAERQVGNEEHLG
jgi:hypothetical protein